MRHVPEKKQQRCLASVLAGIELTLGASGFGTLGTCSSCRCVAPARLQIGLARKSKANVMPPIKQANRVDRGPDPGSLRHALSTRPHVDFSTWGPFGERIAKRCRFSASGQLRSVELSGPGSFNPGQCNAQDMQHVGPGIGADPGCIPPPDVPLFAPALADTGHVWSNWGSSAGRSLVGDAPRRGDNVSSPERIIRRPKR